VCHREQRDLNGLGSDCHGDPGRAKAIISSGDGVSTIYRGETFSSVIPGGWIFIYPLEHLVAQCWGEKRLRRGQARYK